MCVGNRGARTVECYTALPYAQLVPEHSIGLLEKRLGYCLYMSLCKRSIANRFPLKRWTSDLRTVSRLLFHTERLHALVADISYSFGSRID